MGQRSSPCACSATTTGSRENTRRVCACAVVMFSNTADFLCVNSSVCQVVMMMVMIDALCAVMEQRIRLSPGKPHHNVFVTCGNSRVRTRSKRMCRLR